jgi:hypothetical protein
MDTNTVSYKGWVIPMPDDIIGMSPEPNDFLFEGRELQTLGPDKIRFRAVQKAGFTDPEDFATDVRNAHVLLGVLDVYLPGLSDGVFSYSNRAGEQCEGSASDLEHLEQKWVIRKLPEPDVKKRGPSISP